MESPDEKAKTQLPELGFNHSGKKSDHQVAAETATCACSGGRGGNGGNHSCNQCPIRPRKRRRHHAGHGGDAIGSGEKAARHERASVQDVAPALPGLCRGNLRKYWEQAYSAPPAEGLA
jgi:hypothetical protein